MATQTTQAPPVRPIGGHLEPRENIAEYTMNALFGTPISPEAQINQGPVSLDELSQMRQGESGSMSGFQTTRRKEDVFPQLRTETLRSELAAAHQETISAEALKKKREEVNVAIGIKNVVYEDTVSDDGKERVDVKVYLETKNSELEAKNLKAQREEQLVTARKKATSPKGAIGPQVNMNTTFEDQNMSRPG